MTHLRQQELLGSLADLSLRSIAVPAPGGERAALQRRRGAIEDEDGADAKIEELAYAAEEPQQVRVADHLSAVVPHRPHELHHPDARVHSDALPSQGLHRHAPPHRGQQLPQPVHSHVPSLECRRTKDRRPWRWATRRGSARRRVGAKGAGWLTGYDSPCRRFAVGRPVAGNGQRRFLLRQFGPLAEGIRVGPFCFHKKKRLGPFYAIWMGSNSM